jgi:hypothetical protein
MLTEQTLYRLRDPSLTGCDLSRPSPLTIHIHEPGCKNSVICKFVTRILVALCPQDLCARDLGFVDCLFWAHCTSPGILRGRNQVDSRLENQDEISGQRAPEQSDLCNLNRADHRTGIVWIATAKSLRNTVSAGVSKNPRKRISQPGIQPDDTSAEQRHLPHSTSPKPGLPLSKSEGTRSNLKQNRIAGTRSVK